MMDAYISSIWAFGFNFAPSGWALCNGQLMSIANNQALFTLIGTTYGGDGVSTFAVPDLQGRQPVGIGQGPGLSNIVLGQKAGAESVTITNQYMAAHTHPASGSVSIAVNSPTPPVATASNPSGNFYSSEASLAKVYASSGGNSMALASTPSGSTFSGPTPVGIMNPYLVVNYCICVNGIYPSRN